MQFEKIATEIPRIFYDNALNTGSYGSNEEKLKFLTDLREEMNSHLNAVSARKKNLLGKMKCFEMLRQGRDVAPEPLESLESRKRPKPEDSFAEADQSMGPPPPVAVKVEVKEEAWQIRRRQQSLQGVKLDKKARKNKFGRDEGTDSDSDTERLKTEMTPLPDDAGRVRAAKDVGANYWAYQDSLFRPLSDADLKLVADLDEENDPAFRIPEPGTAEEVERPDPPERWSAFGNLLADGRDLALDAQPLSLKLLAALIHDPSMEGMSVNPNLEDPNFDFSISTSINAISIEAKVKAEMAALGLLDPIESYPQHPRPASEDDEISLELKKLQNMLRDHIASQAALRRPLYLKALAEIPRERKREEQLAAVRALEACLGKHGGKISKSVKPPEVVRLCKQWDTLYKEERNLMKIAEERNIKNSRNSNNLNQMHHQMQPNQQIMADQARFKRPAVQKQQTPQFQQPMQPQHQMQNYSMQNNINNNNINNNINNNNNNNNNNNRNSPLVLAPVSDEAAKQAKMLASFHHSHR